MSCPFTQCPNYNTCPVVNLEFPITQCGVYTARSLCHTLTNAQFPDEVALLSDNATFMRLYREVRIRFDTAPKNYQKQDYQRLLELFRFLDGVDSSFEKTEITTSIGLDAAIDPGAYSVVLPSIETTLGVTTYSMIVLPQGDDTLQIAYFINADGEAKMYERLITNETPLVLGPWVDSDAHLIHKVLNAEGKIPMFDVNGNLVVSSISSDSSGNITMSETLTVDGNISVTGDITGANLSNTNTGDETAGTIIDKLGYTPADDADLTLLEARTSGVESTVSTLSVNLTWKPQISSTAGNEATDLIAAYPLAVEGWIANVDTGTETVSWRFNGLIWEIFNSSLVPLVTTTLDGRMRKEDKAFLDTLGSSQIHFVNKPKQNYSTTEEFVRVQYQLGSYFNSAVQIPVNNDVPNGFNVATHDGLISFYVGNVSGDSHGDAFGDEGVLLVAEGVGRIFLMMNDGGLQSTPKFAKLKDIYGKQVLCHFTGNFTRSAVLVSMSSNQEIIDYIDSANAETINPYKESLNTYTVVAGTKENVNINSTGVGGVVDLPTGVLIEDKFILFIMSEYSEDVTIGGTVFTAGDIVYATYIQSEDEWQVTKKVAPTVPEEKQGIDVVNHYPRFNTPIVLSQNKGPYINITPGLFSAETQADLAALSIGDIVLLTDMTFFGVSSGFNKGKFRVVSKMVNNIHFSPIKYADEIEMVKVAEGRNQGLWMNNYDKKDEDTIIFTKVQSDKITLTATTTDDSVVELLDEYGENPLADILLCTSWVMLFNAVKGGDGYGFIGDGIVFRDLDSRGYMARINTIPMFAEETLSLLEGGMGYSYSRRSFEVRGETGNTITWKVVISDIIKI